MCYISDQCEERRLAVNNPLRTYIIDLRLDTPWVMCLGEDNLSVSCIGDLDELEIIEITAP